MKQVKRPTMIFGGVFIILFLINACHRTSQVAFYTLNGQISHHSVQKNSAELEDLSVGIGSVHLPDYLERPQIVTFKGVSRLHLAEFHRWAGRLDGEITRVMINNLSMLLGTPQVLVFPWGQSETPQFRLDLIFHHFEGILGETVRIKGVWHLSQNTPEAETLHQPFDQSVTISGPEYEDLVVACNQGLWELSQEISRVIQRKVAMSTHK